MNISMERVRDKLGEKEVQCLLYEQIIEQNKDEIKQLKQKIASLESTNEDG